MARGTQSGAYAAGLVRYDAEHRRVWICGQRLHHGLTGALLTAAGIALMAHDRRDRSAWFRLGS
ncbi:MAG: hypothetical protein AABM66_06785 [Actinomycetota bacterium]